MSGVPALAIGESCTLTIEGVDEVLPMTVRSHADQGLHVAFKLDAAAATALRHALRRIPRKAA